MVLDARALKDSAARAVVNNTGLIEARTIDNSSGTIKLLGDMHNGVVQQSGTLDASAPAGGDGGFVETSAFKVETADSARVSTAAPQGRAGTWLIDPTNYTIADQRRRHHACDAREQPRRRQCGDPDRRRVGTDAGDISVKDAVSWNSANTLTLSAHHDINVNADITAPNGRLVLRADSEGLGTSSAGGTVIFRCRRHGEHQSDRPVLQPRQLQRSRQTST